MFDAMMEYKRDMLTANLYSESPGENCGTACSADAVLEDRKLKKLDAVYKNAKQNQRKRVFRSLLDLPVAVIDHTLGWQVFVLFLLALATPVVFSAIPCLPVIVLEGLTLIPEALERMVSLFNPFEAVGGKAAKSHPSCLKLLMKHRIEMPSDKVADYLGGRKKHRGKGKIQRPFYFAMPFAVASNVPDKVVESIIQGSPLSVPFLCGKRKSGTARTVIRLNGTPLESNDPDALSFTRKQANLIRAELQFFLVNLKRKRKRQDKLLDGVSTYIPMAKSGRYQTPLSNNPEVRFWAMGLSVLESLLKFAVKQDWISEEEAQDTLLEAWAAILPESAPVAPAEITSPNYCARWDSLPVFWEFLDGYITENQEYIVKEGKGHRETVAIFWERDEVTYIIFPREKFAAAYASFVREHEGAVPQSRFDLHLARQMLDTWRLTILTEGDDVSRRHTFYKKNEAPEGCKNSLPCIAIPVEQLPENLRVTLGLCPATDYQAREAEIVPEPESVTGKDPLSQAEQGWKSQSKSGREGEWTKNG